MSSFKHPHCHPLLVDDDSNYMLLLARSFERIGVPPYQIRSCVDGDQAIKLLSGGGWIPSFVLLDLQMPQRSGLEVLEWIRSAPPPLAEVPVFMLTLSSEPDQVSRAFELRVRSYFIKPLDVHDLEVVLEGILADWIGRARSVGGLNDPGRTASNRIASARHEWRPGPGFPS
jgi:CheY-like chemotaxis protein